MLIRLVPPSPHPTILYAVTFPNVLPLHDLGPSATLPAAWSSQLQIITSILQLKPPSSIHALDRAVGLVARVHEVSMDVPQKEFMVRFVDGREISIPMNSDCVRMLLSVAVDVKGCSEPESQRNSMEGSACPGSTVGSAENLPPGGNPTKPPKSGKHKRQRSFLFSLISSLVPKSLSLSSPSPPSSAPPPTPLPPLPVAGRVTSPASSRQTSFASAQLIQNFFAGGPEQPSLMSGGVTSQQLSHLNNLQLEIQSIETVGSRGFGVSGTRAGGNKHRRTRSEGRNALDFGHRSDDCELEQWRCRAPSPFPDMLDTEDIDRVVYPRREQADEWGVRYLYDPRSSGEADVFAVEYDGHNDNLLGEHFTVGDDWDDNERLTLELSHIGRHGTTGIGERSSNFDDTHLHQADFGLDYSNVDGSRLADTAFDVSRCPLTPSDVNDDGESDDSQTSLRTPEDGEVLPLAPLSQGSAQHATRSASQPPLVSRVSSSRPRSRNASAQYSSVPSTPVQVSRPPTPSTPRFSSLHDFEYRDAQVDEFIASRFAYLDRIYTALGIVRSRAREEGWKLVRATSIGAENEWMDAEAESSLEIKGKRRAWSSGIKILSTFMSSRRPPGLTSPSTGVPQVRGPIVPTGLSLGIPVRSSPLAMYVWGADDGQKSTPSKYGILNSVHSTETIEGKRSSRVTFADSVTRLFPVYEDEGENSIEPVQVNAVGFPQAVPVSVSAEDTECGLIEGLADNEDDPFYFCPSRPRTRTTSMYVMSPTPSAPSSPVLPMLRPSTPPPSYQAAVSAGVSTTANDEEGRLDASALLLQPLSSISSSPQSLSSRPSLSSNPPFVPRPRAASLPTPRVLF
ncbi:hypothetical protein J3R83DRAFT_13891 [Lanmaoa asiatica]|nr:hypothetical protein J3R83DRAFT_13891 [Lanmaoa asiatica]